mgnify:CR=1 FL=1
MELYYSLLTTVVSQEGGGGGGAMGILGSPIVMFVLMFGIIYLMLIRPQQKQQKKHRELLEALKSGDRVITQSGILGRIKSIDGTIVTLEIDHKVNIRLLKAQISGLQAPETKEQKEVQKEDSKTDKA